MCGAILRASFAIALLAVGATAAPPASAASPAERGQPALSAAKNDHAARARILEELGKTEAAAREYEAAFQETHDAENLYHLAICKRILGDYSAAREALRGYLREAPDGPLAVEVERQLAHLAVLIEARGLQSPKPAPKSPAKSRPDRARAGLAGAQTPDTASSPAAVQTSIEAKARTASAAPNESHPTPGPTSSAAAAPSAPDAASNLPAAPPSPSIVTAQASTAWSTTSSNAPAPVRSDARNNQAPDMVGDRHEAPAAALPSAQVNAKAPSRYQATPWLVGGAVALGTAGAILCVGSHEISSDLNDRYNAGELTSSDLPRYSKARAEGIAGTALIGAAVIAIGTAVVLAW